MAGYSGSAGVYSRNPLCQATLLCGEEEQKGVHPSTWITLLTSSALPRAQFLGSGIIIRGGGQGLRQKSGSCCQQLSAL